MKCNQRNKRWVVVASIVCLATGFLAGITVRRPAPDQPGTSDNTLTPSLQNKESTMSDLITKYQEEIVRLTRVRLSDNDELQENQLLLREMNRRGIDADAPACRRLIDEIQAAKNSVLRTDSQAARARERLAELNHVRNSRERQHNGIDGRTEVNAARAVMEYEAGLLSP